MVLTYSEKLKLSIFCLMESKYVPSIVTYQKLVQWGRAKLGSLKNGLPGLTAFTNSFQTLVHYKSSGGQLQQVRGDLREKVSR